jgi:uncharacterized protein (UPF0332 family)
MFYVAEALLLQEGLSFSSHSAVASTFGQRFAKTGRVPAEFHRMLMDAREIREDGDYGGLHAISAAQAHEQISHAEQFLQLAERLIGAVPPKPRNGN